MEVFTTIFNNTCFKGNRRTILTESTVSKDCVQENNIKKSYIS